MIDPGHAPGNSGSFFQAVLLTIQFVKIVLEKK